MTTLEKLDISRNNLRELPESLVLLTRLRTLDVGGNRFVTVRIGFSNINPPLPPPPLFFPFSSSLYARALCPCTCLHP